MILFLILLLADASNIVDFMSDARNANKASSQ